MKLEVTTYLSSFQDPRLAIKELEENYKLEIQHKDNLFLLNYGRDSPHHPITDDCRALVLKFPTWEVVSFSFRRFYNLHEGHAAFIDWASSIVYEKLDGSLILFFHDGQQWRMQTRGNIDALGELPDRSAHFYERINFLLKTKGYDDLDHFMDGFSTHFCLVMEYIGPHNRIVTHYPDENLCLIAITNKNTLSYESLDKFPHWPFIYPKTYSLGSVDEVISSLDMLPQLNEGYVVCDKHGNRVKIKNPAYLAISHAINAGSLITNKHYIAIAMRQDADELKSYFPELVDQVEHFENVINVICEETEKAWEINKDAPDQKTFALAVKELIMSSWLFLKRAGKTNLSVKQYIAQHVKPEWLAKRI